MALSLAAMGSSRTWVYLYQVGQFEISTLFFIYFRQALMVDEISVEMVEAT
jgi:hypothetical protein